MKRGKLVDALNGISFFKKYTGVLLVLIALIAGLFTYKDYGISWDEQLQHIVGQTSYDYVLHGNLAPLTFKNNDYLNSMGKAYGVAYAVPLILLEKLSGLKDTRDIYLLRHLVTHLFFLFSAFIFFLLIDYLYKNKLLATIGFLLLVVNPLIYGHSFFNPKDIPFLSLFIICFMLSALAFNKNTYKNFALLGAGCGLLTDIRILGILLIGCICLFFVLDFISVRKDKKQLKKSLSLFFTFIITSAVSIYVAWPYLWISPLHNFVYAFKTMSKYGWDKNVMFNGQTIAGTNLPWNYSITWFLISNPIIYLVLGVWGMAFFIFRFCKNYTLYLFNRKERNNLLYLICFVAPFLSVIILHSVLYDSWRQLYFVYPSFILLAIYGLNKLIRTKARIVVLAVVIASIGSAGYYMIANYPFEHVYFNRFVRTNEPEYLRKNWELDYWGTSFKQGLEYILKSDTFSKINVAVSDSPGKYNSMILKHEDRKRIHYVNTIDSARYFITDYRYHHDDYPYNSSQVYYSIKVLNSSILTVFKLR